MRLFPVGFLLLLTSSGLQCIAAYRKYYVEDECNSPNKEQKVIFRLPASGSDSVGELRSNRFGTYSRTGRDCLIQIVPPKGYGIIVTVLKVDFRNHASCKDYIKIYDDGNNGEKLCGYQELGFENKTYFSEDKVKIDYHTSVGGMGFHDGFRLIFTVTKLDEEADACSSPEDFKCENSHCIWAGVTCDGINNCGDASDEKSLEHPYCRTYPPLSENENLPFRLAEVTPVAIAAVVLGITSFVAVLVAMCVCCCRGQTDKPQKPPLIDDFPWRPNAGYIPLPGYTYGSIRNTSGHLLQMHSPAPYASEPMEYSQACSRGSGFPIVQQKVEIRYDRPPPYRA